MVVSVASENWTGSCAHAFLTENDQDELDLRIAKVRLAKAMKLRGYPLGNVAWDVLEEEQADALLSQIGGKPPGDPDLEGNERVRGALTPDEFDLVLESKTSWDQRKLG